MERVVASAEKLAAAAGTARDSGMERVFDAGDRLAEATERVLQIRPRIVGDTYLETKVTDTLRNPVFYICLPATRIWEELRGTTISVPEDARVKLKEEGAAIFVSNHPGTDSSILFQHAINKVTGEMPIVVVKEELKDPTFEESEEVHKRTGKLRAKKGPVKKAANPIVRKVTSAIINNAAETIAIRRGKLESSTIRKVNKAIQDGKKLGIFLQETRTPEDSLANARPAAALLVRMNPDIPVYLMTQRNTQVKFEGNLRRRRPWVVFSQPFTLREIDPEGRMSKNAIHEYIVDRMEGQLKAMGIEHVSRISVWHHESSRTPKNIGQG